MGTTRAALHLIATAAAPSAKLDPATILSAYRALGWATSGTEQAGRDATLFIQSEGDALTLIDSACTRYDDGTLRALAAHLSKNEGIAAFVTDVVDSDTCSLTLYADGAQIDTLAYPDTAVNSATTAVLPDDARPAAWARLFGARFMGFPEAPDAPSPFAEDTLAGWLAALGLAPSLAGLSLDDLDNDPSAGTALMHLHLALAAPAAEATPLLEGVARPLLSSYFDPDDSPHLPVYPGAWPLEPNTGSPVKWIILSGGGGFDGLTLTIAATETTGTIHLSALRAVAYGFHNGQITSPTPVAQAELRPGTRLTDGTTSYTFAPFSLPDLDPQAKRRIAIVLSLDLALAPVSQTRLALNVTPLSPAALSLALPPARLTANAPHWYPAGSDGRALSFGPAEALRIVNTPSVLSGVSILATDDEPTRSAVQEAMDGFVAAFDTPAGTTLTLRTLKHMTPSGSIAKRTIELSPEALAAEKVWHRALAAKSDLQTVALNLTPPGAALPMAGAVLQMTLRDEAEQAPCAPHLSFWMADHPEAEAALGLTRNAFGDRFRAWCARAPLLQAHLLSAAWIPLFDLYTDYAQTPFETLSLVEPALTGLHGAGMRADRCAGTLRLLAPEMWLAPALADRISPASLSGIADVTPGGTNGTTRIILAPDAQIAGLEAALAAIVP